MAENDNHYTVDKQQMEEETSFMLEPVTVQNGKVPSKTEKPKAFGLSYLVNEHPPWYLCIWLAFQHFLTMLGSTLAIPFILQIPMCFQGNKLVISEILSTIFFVSGIATLLQTTFGVRLPIVQGGGSLAFVGPTFSILSLPQWKCPDLSDIDLTEVWQVRMREIQGAIMVTGLIQIVIGFAGVVGFFLRFIGPLTIAPTITLMGISLFSEAAESAGKHWGISMMTIALLVIFSQYLSRFDVPLPAFSRDRGCHVIHYPLFRSFPIIMAIISSWIICAIITAAGGFPSDPDNPNYLARTDRELSVLKEAQWFRFPYPGQWGTPTISYAGVLGMLTGLLASLIESVGDYHACARLSGAPPPPKHAMNRGIAAEGIGVFVAGAFGCGIDTTAYGENIGAIGITKVGSLRVIQVGGFLFMIFGMLGKFGALFVTIPDPIIGGVFMVMFGMITAVGISNLQYADMNSSRNLFIVGFSLVFGLAVPYYMEDHMDAIQTGVNEIDQIVTVLLSTSMAVGCIVPLILDNTIPGTIEERGLTGWGENRVSDEPVDEKYEVAPIEVYNLPFGLHRLSKFKFAKYMPFLPYPYDNGQHQENTLRPTLCC
ncbi:Solute carrier family 23 member 2 [Acropora cervicornis]|uniref:Solute carrier family 23 member 2 n=1 Tax=Acropora cervicornis TaxID=6130 RepID=A0AAD9V460_ACRCE|nr:Solute carrier family 23 member 2 [Acropora cervicornis]